MTKPTNLQLDIVPQGFQDNQLETFWISKWNQTMQKLTGSDIDPDEFQKQSYFYVVKSDDQIIAVMSSTWQTCDTNLLENHYYSAYPESIYHLKFKKIKSFHKMGMIIVEPRAIPKGIKIIPVLVGCGLSFALNLAECQACVSFPRTDTSVYKSCLEWGAQDIKNGLTLFNAPVAYVYCSKSEFKQHLNSNIKNLVDNLISNQNYKTIKQAG